MCEDKELELTDEIPVLFSDDMDLLEDTLTDIVLAMGLPEQQTAAVLRLFSDAIDTHHGNVLDTFESTLDEEEEDEVNE